MPDLENQAALTDEALDAQIAEAAKPVELESAPEPEVKPEEPEVKEDGFQKRINKVTADKYAEKRRADEAEQKLKELQAAAPVQSVSDAPKLEDFDYDQDKYNDALIDHRVNAAVNKQVATQKEASSQESAQKAAQAFNERVATFGKDDFNDVANAIPVLPSGVADALVGAENGAELIYHLGTHLDVADKLSSMTPQMAMMELGRISANMSAQPETKLSAAPEPITPISSGGSLSKDIGEMSMAELYSM
jgi:hypothetical protein